MLPSALMEASKLMCVCWAEEKIMEWKPLSLTKSHLQCQLSYALPFQIGKDVEVTDREMRQRFQIGTEEGPVEGLDVPPQGDGPEVDNCWFWFANGGYFSPDYPVDTNQIMHSMSMSTIFVA